jgi:hypothetical protein
MENEITANLMVEGLTPALKGKMDTMVKAGLVAESREFLALVSEHPNKAHHFFRRVMRAAGVADGEGESETPEEEQGGALGEPLPAGLDPTPEEGQRIGEAWYVSDDPRRAERARAVLLYALNLPALPPGETDPVFFELLRADLAAERAGMNLEGAA